VVAFGIQVRPIGIRDLIRLRAMRTDVLMPDQVYGPMGVRRPDPRAALPGSRRIRRSFVAYVDNQPAGLIDLVSDPANHRWVLSRILTRRQLPDGNEPSMRESIWRELALHAVRSAGAARAKRIHAMLDVDSPVVQVLESTGFAIYAQDTFLALTSEPDFGPAGIVRPQEPSDVWAIHHLYHQVTPRPVQYAEALTSNFWGRIVPGQPASRGYVVEDGLEVVAHCRVTRGCDGPVLHLMVRHDAQDLLVPIVRDVMSDLGPQGKRVVGVVVPDYLQEHVAPLESIGFEQIGRQSRMVKYTVVARRMQFRGVEEIVKDASERVPAGSPTLSYAPYGEAEQSSRGNNVNRTST
jgi:hypothetical protein